MDSSLHMVPDKRKQGKICKSPALIKYHSLIIALINYNIENDIEPAIRLTDRSELPDVIAFRWFRFIDLANDYYNQNKIADLRKLYNELTEPFIDTLNFSINDYLLNKTGYNIDIFAKYFEKIDKVIAKGKIINDSQFFDLNNLVTGLNYLGINDERAKKLNDLLESYYSKKYIR